MVELKELRFGNWIRLNDSEYWTPEVNGKIIRVDEDVLHAMIMEGRGKSYDYVPLTAKLLLKFGFVATNGIGVTNYQFNGFLISVLSDGSIHYKNTEIKYVHHLQNLFQAITLLELNDISDLSD